MSFYGHIDLIRSSGFIEGWALDVNQFPRPLAISIADGDDAEIGNGLANLYREDLAGANIGGGWCFFRLRALVPPSRFRRQALKLKCAVTKTTIGQYSKIIYAEDYEEFVLTVADVLASDPFSLDSINQLSACDAIFNRYMLARGVIEFIRTAYIYILGRPADNEGIALYSKMLRRQTCTPFEFLIILSESDEFKKSNRVLKAPISDDFPFSC